VRCWASWMAVGALWKGPSAVRGTSGISSIRSAAVGSTLLAVPPRTHVVAARLPAWLPAAGAGLLAEGSACSAVQGAHRGRGPQEGGHGQAGAR
jgi:hypothetical protein